MTIASTYRRHAGPIALTLAGIAAGDLAVWAATKGRRGLPVRLANLVQIAAVGGGLGYLGARLVEHFDQAAHASKGEGIELGLRAQLNLVQGGIPAERHAAAAGRVKGLPRTS
jgi:hypothetical protein